MTYLLILAHLVVVGWGTRVVCRWLHDRRVPRAADVRAVQVGFLIVCALVVLAVLCDVTDGGRPLAMTRMMWEFAMLVSTVFSALVILVLRNSSLPRAGTGGPGRG